MDNLNELQGEVNALRSQMANLRTIIYRDDHPTERIILAALSIEASACADDDGQAALSGPKKALAERLHLSVSTVTDTLDKLKKTGKVKVDSDSTPTNWQTGEPVNRENRYNRTQSVRWVVDTTIFTPALLADVLPDKLPDSPRQTRAKSDATKKRLDATNNRAELRELRNLVKEIESHKCPHCGERHLGIICGSCGTILTDDDLCQAETFRVREPDGVTQNTCVTNTESLPVILKESLSKAGDITQSPPIVDPCDDIFPLDNQPPPPLTVDITPSQPHVEPPDGETLRGADTIDYQDALDACFCFAHAPGEDLGHGKIATGKEPINPRDDFGDELSWPDVLIEGPAAKLHLARGGNVGLQTGLKAGQTIGYASIDFDQGYKRLHVDDGLLASLPRIWREDDLDRAKSLVLIDEPITSAKYEGNGYKIDVLGDGHMGVIAGTHRMGAAIQFTTGALVVMTNEQIHAHARKLTGAPADANPAPAAATESPPPQSVNPESDGLARQLVSDWNQDLSNQRAVDSLIVDKCKCAGKYFAIRSNDTSPSVLRNTDRFGKRTYTDFGDGNRHYDDFELYCLLTGKDKRALIREMVKEYHLAREAVMA